MNLINACFPTNRAEKELNSPTTLFVRYNRKKSEKLEYVSTFVFFFGEKHTQMLFKDQNNPGSNSVFT